MRIATYYVYLLLKVINVGCMESLVHYKKLILQKHVRSVDTESQGALREECRDLLEKLQTIDPNRRQRYVELGMFLPEHNFAVAC